jgi:hypothetical protein
VELEMEPTCNGGWAEAFGLYWSMEGRARSEKGSELATGPCPRAYPPDSSPSPIILALTDAR